MASTPLASLGSANPGGRPVLIAVGAAGLLSAAVVWRGLGDATLGAIFLAGFVAVCGVILLVHGMRAPQDAAAHGIDWALARAAIEVGDQAIAITGRDGTLRCANSAYESWFAGLPAPPVLPVPGPIADVLAEAARKAWRDGEARCETGGAGGFVAEIVRAGRGEDYLVWRLRRGRGRDLAQDAASLIAGEAGDRIAAAGMMAALVDRDGFLRAANRVFLMRAFGSPDADPLGRAFVDLLRSGEDDLPRIAREGDEAEPLRLIQIPLDEDEPRGPLLFLMLDQPGGAGGGSTGARQVEELIAMLPLGLALAEREGRLLFMNEAFRRAAGLGPGQTAVYPGDLVVKEDKGAVADAVRRFATGRGISGDMSVRLLHKQEEPIALTIAGVKGLGQAAVLLSLKDNSEESRLKRQVAQQTKMQAVGQLAGGVAHDFNNILTAIIGHCDLMLMRHTPGDSDYDDIQQIRLNSNRAAALTRQLLAFSRQQTMHPQVVQLPDVVSETSSMLKRLLGENVSLVVKHGRDLGPVRVDPGQLEQVIVNLAVNARDAMPEGGVVTLQTYAVSSGEVRRLGSDIMPITDYTVLTVSDTGVGIAPDILGKIFEPFFTTKEVGKGTGLGLSTVYGIVKQSGGFIFPDSEPAKGTSFAIYLPVHRADPRAAIASPPKVEKAAELWGSGTVLLVEDEDMVRAVAERALARQGYTVLTAANGELALEILESDQKVDLLISDVMMPGMDGPTLVRHARAKFPDMPVLFMSGYAEEQVRRSIDLDKVAFLPKPFSVKQLAEAARDALPPPLA